MMLNLFKAKPLNLLIIDFVIVRYTSFMILSRFQIGLTYFYNFYVLFTIPQHPKFRIF